MQDIVGHFEAYAAVKQTLPMVISPIRATQTCRAPWRLRHLASAVRLSVQYAVVHAQPQAGLEVRHQSQCHGRQRRKLHQHRSQCVRGGVSDSPFGYFCDDLLGMWIITYFWFTQPPNTTVQLCHTYSRPSATRTALIWMETPIILTAHELNDELEANGCGAEGQEAVDGSDGGAVWLVCPAIPDPRAGAIAKDAFLDQVAPVERRTADRIRSVLNQLAACRGGKFCLSQLRAQQNQSGVLQRVL